ncbi:lamin tail domain-containing protein [bacterium]|nr:lamin tail domain-containing protein [bacterium]
MADPSAVTDTDGEWLEIYNTTSSAITLDGFILTRGTTNYTLNQTGLSVAGNSYFVFAKKDAATSLLPRVDATLALSLTNSGEQTLSIKIDQLVLDEVTYTETSKPGKSFQLSSASLNATSNNDWANWCVGTTAISSENTDLGTPGTANTVCGD